MTIVDELFCRASHAVEMFWHFAEGCEVTLDGTRVTARNGSAQLAIEVPQGTRCELVRGREDVPLGWISRCFDQLAPTSTLLVQGTARGNARLVTRIELSIVAARSDARPPKPVSNRGSLHEQRRVKQSTFEEKLAAAGAGDVRECSVALNQIYRHLLGA